MCVYHLPTICSLPEGWPAILRGVYLPGRCASCSPVCVMMFVGWYSDLENWSSIPYERRSFLVACSTPQYFSCSKPSLCSTSCRYWCPLPDPWGAKYLPPLSLRMHLPRAAASLPSPSPHSIVPCGRSGRIAGPDVLAAPFIILNPHFLSLFWIKSDRICPMTTRRSSRLATTSGCCTKSFWILPCMRLLKPWWKRVWDSPCCPWSSLLPAPDPLCISLLWS
mmetsp:Transcript_13329/g.29476  ORF Transcript_13329/g.29476 Transcript_13329/m.29476 type:complete len:222 (-) Transcript_13329:369-1034(-)